MKKKKMSIKGVLFVGSIFLVYVFFGALLAGSVMSFVDKVPPMDTVTIHGWYLFNIFIICLFLSCLFFCIKFSEWSGAGW